MKWIKRLVIILVIGLVVLFLGLLIFLKTLDTNRFKGKLAQQIGAKINRSVSLKGCAFSFSIGRGVTLQISGLAVMDHPDFSSKPFASIESAHLNIEILPLITNRQVLISKIVLDSLKVQLIRNKSGEYNFQEFIKEDKSEEIKTDQIAASKEENPHKAAPTIKKKEINFGDLLIRSIQFTDGAVHFTDETVSPSMNLSLKQIDFQVLDLSGGKAFPIQLNASLWSNKKNIRLKGLARIDPNNKQIRVDDLVVKTDLSDIQIKSIIDSYPSVKDLGMQGNLEGQLTLDVEQMVMGEKGLFVLTSQARLSDGKIHFKDMPAPIEQMNMLIEISESDIQIKAMTMSLASGEIKMEGEVIDYFSEQAFNLNLEMGGIQISELVSQLKLPVKLEGKLYDHIKVSGKGFNEDALKATLNGDGNFGIHEGRIVDINILKLVLSKLSFIPNLANQVEQNLPDRYKAVLKRKDTALEKVEINTHILNDALMIKKAEIIADGFSIIAQGALDYDLILNLNADFFIPSDLSARMVEVVEELKLLLNPRGQIQIPLKEFRGKIDNFRMYPDVNDLGKQLIRNRGKDELKKVLNKVFDLEEAPSKAPKGEGTTKPQEQEIRPEEVLIENILDLIPKF